MSFQRVIEDLVLAYKFDLIFLVVFCSQVHSLNKNQSFPLCTVCTEQVNIITLIVCFYLPLHSILIPGASPP